MGCAKVDGVLETVEHTVVVTLLLHIEVTERLEFVEHVEVIEHVDATMVHIEAGVVLDRWHTNEAGVTSPLNSS